MNLFLKRSSYEASGIYSFLTSQEGSLLLAITLEHAYVGSNEPVCYIPKLPPGTYTCVRGIHKLAGMAMAFETFEIMDVPGHSGILFHIGNYNEDSEGCVLLGSARSGNMITQSANAFRAFMMIQAGVSSFQLVVE